MRYQYNHRVFVITNNKNKNDEKSHGLISGWSAVNNKNKQLFFEKSSITTKLAANIIFMGKKVKPTYICVWFKNIYFAVFFCNGGDIEFKITNTTANALPGTVGKSIERIMKSGGGKVQHRSSLEAIKNDLSLSALNLFILYNNKSLTELKSEKTDIWIYLNLKWVNTVLKNYWLFEALANSNWRPVMKKFKFLTKLLSYVNWDIIRY